MSAVGKTLLRGHGLLNEGRPYFAASGHRASSWLSEMASQYGKCRCGELFGPGWSQSRIKREHRAHKDAIRAAS